jgi:hypothetical protein
MSAGMQGYPLELDLLGIYSTLFPHPLDWDH